jgi:hypothetical protein
MPLSRVLLSFTRRRRRVGHRRVLELKASSQSILTCTIDQTELPSREPHDSSPRAVSV